MATNVVLNGVTYSIPAVGDSGWGASLSSFLVAVPTGVLTKAGGSFALTAGVDFGASYGLSSISYASRSTPATAGVFRLGNTQAVSWRNQANTSNLDLSVNASNVLTFNSVPVLSTAATGVQTFLTTPSSANLAAAVTDETGSGALVFATSPTLVTPTLGTPASGTLTNCTGLPVGSGISGLGSGVATFLATPSSANLRTAITDETGSGALVFATSPNLVTPALGTPSSGILTSCTGLPVSTGIAGLGSGVATFLATPSSANLLAAMTDETGTGALVFATSPTLVTPALGTPSSGTLTSCTGLPIDGGTTGTLPIARGGTGLTALGSPTQALRVNAGGTALEYFTITGTGDVVGPASSTSDHVVLFDGTTGKLLKGAGFTGSDVGRLSTTQIFTGDKTFQGALTIPGSITMAANTFARSGAHNLTLTTTGTTNVTLPTTGTLAITGANTFTAAQTINTASNQIVLSSGVNQLTLNSGTSTATRIYTVPDVGGTAQFVMTAGTQNSIGGAKTFTSLLTASAGLTVSGGSAANLSLWSASNVLNLRGGTSGLDILNTSNAVIADFQDNGNIAFDTSTLFVDAVNNRVGIGTTGPVAPLVIDALSFNGQIGFGRNTTAVGYGFIGARDTSALEVYTGGTTSGSPAIGTKLIDVTHTGSVTLGPPVVAATDGVAHFVRTGDQGTTLNVSSANAGTIQFANAAVSAASPLIAGTTNDAGNAHGLFIGAFTNDGTTGGDMCFDVRENDNTDFATTANNAFVWRRFGNALISTTRAGSVTLGPSAGGVNHTIYCGDAGSGTARSILIRPDAAFTTTNDENWIGTAGRLATSADAAIGSLKNASINPTGLLYLRTEDNIGTYLWVDNADQFRIGTVKTQVGTTNGTVVGTQTSDERLKQNIQPISYGLEKVMQLEPLQFDKDGVHCLGFGAQRTQSVLPEAVFDTKDFVFGDDEPSKLGMEYVQVIPVLTKAIQELSAKLDAALARIAKLEG